MKPVSIHDYYQTKRCYGASSMDLASLTDFYLPLIGVQGYGVYNAFLREDEATHVHESLLLFLGLTPGEFERACQALEAVGLIRTFVAKEGAASLFVYCLYAPLHASEFASDIMLSGTVKGRLGIEAFDRLWSRHQGEKDVPDMEEVSISFPEYFKPSFDAKFYLSAEEHRGQRSGKAMAKTGFDRVAFQKELESLGLRKNALSDEELSKIEQVATLYSIGEKLMAELTFSCIKANAPVGKKLNVEELSAHCYKASFVPSLQEDKGEKSNISSDTETAKMIRIMDETKPAAFLRIMQNNHNPAKVDLKLLEHLQLGLGLPSPCLNALVFYVLTTKQNTLPAPYCEKLAASLVREGCRSARDAMDYLLRGKGRKKKEKPMMEGKPQAKPKPVSKESEAEEVSDEAVDEALKDLFDED